MKNQELKREIGVWGLSANLINIIVGAGVFVLPAIVAEGLGSAAILAYLFCGILVALIMLCFAEVGSKITTSGGPYTYIEAAFGKYFGFLTAVFFLCACVTADAAVANALVGVLGKFLPIFQEAWFRILFFILLFTGLAYINVLGVKEGLRVVKIITIAKLAPLLLLVSFGWTEVSLINLEWTAIPGIKEIGEVSLILFFAFQGGESGLSVGGEVKNPQKTVPRAIFLSIASILILYMLIQTVAQGVLGDTLASYTEGPLSEAAKVIFGPIGFTVMTIGAAVSMFGNISSEVLSIPRVFYGAAKDGVFPIKGLAKVHAKYATPYVAIIIYAGIGLLLASLGGFRQLAVISSSSMLLIYLGVAIAVMRLRKTKKTGANEFRIPGGFLVPIGAILIIVWLLTGLSFEEAKGMLLFAVGLSLLYLLVRVLKSGK